MAIPPDIAQLQMSGLGFTLVYRPGGEPAVFSPDPDLFDDDGISRMIPVGIFVNLPENQSGTWVIEPPPGQGIVTVTWNATEGDWDVA